MRVQGPASEQTGCLRTINAGTHSVYVLICASGSVYHCLDWEPYVPVLATLRIWGAGPAIGQTEHLRSITVGIHIVYMYICSPLKDFHPDQSERRMGWGLWCRLRLMCLLSIFVCVDLCDYLHACAYAYGIYLCMCLLVTHTQPRCWLDLGRGAVTTSPLPDNIYQIWQHPSKLDNWNQVGDACSTTAGTWWEVAR